MNPSPEPDLDRLTALYRYGLLDTPADPFIQAVTDKIASGFGGMAVQAVLVDDHRLVTIAASGPALQERAKPHSLAAAVIGSAAPLAVGDLAADPRFAASPSVGQAPQLRAYLGVQLRTPDQQAIGVLAVSDTRARALAPDHVSFLERGAARLMERLEVRRQERLDPVTGALQRDAFEAHVASLSAVASRHRFPLSVLAVDLRMLRTLLQSFRSDLGTLVINRMSGFGRNGVRRLDAFGRLGDNLFVMLLPNTDEAGARVLGRRIVEGLVDGWSADGDDGTKIAAAGIGIAALRSGQDDAGSLIDRAIRDCRRSWLADLKRAAVASQVA